MYRPFICCCRTPVFPHYTSVYTIHLSLSATDPSLWVTNTGVTQRHLSYRRVWSGGRISRGVYINRDSICVSGCLALTIRDVHLRLTWVIPRRTALVCLYLCQQRSPLNIWCWTGVNMFVFACLCVCVYARVSMLLGVRTDNTKKQHGTKEAVCLPFCQDGSWREAGKGKGRGGNRGSSWRRVWKGTFINSCKNT